MDETKNKRTTDANRDKSKKKILQDKKTKSDTAAFGTSSHATNPSVENFIVVGKGCCHGKSKGPDSGYRLHECYSETDISPLPESNKNFRDFAQGEGLQNVASNSSFISAKSDFSDVFQKKIHDLEDALNQQIVVIGSLKKQIGDRDIIDVNSVSTETDLNFVAIEDHRLKLKALEKKVNSKEKKIKELELNSEECLRAKNACFEENKVLKNQVSLLKRQIHSLFDLLKNKNWTTIDPTEFAKCRNKITELETLIASQEREKNELFRKINVMSSSLEIKEKELRAKTRELVEYKNRSTLEMCKLIDQIDYVQKEAKNQSQILNSKISEVQSSMDEELVNITQKLEEQYQEDVKSAIEKFHADFEKLAELPKTAIEKLLRFCESDKIDFISYQKEWEKQQKMLETKIECLEADRYKEIVQLKDNYETKIAFLKTQVEALFSQLKERKDIIDIFENELMMYKSSSAMNLLKASSLGDDISALKELYTAEIFSQKQVHQLQVNIFEEKVKTLSEEILYHAKKEEIHLQELENAKKLAFTFREKYEKLVSDWEEKAEKDFESAPIKADITPELDTIMADFQNLIQSLKSSEQVHEEILKKMAAQNENEKMSLLQDIQNLKKKYQALKNFHKIQTKLDETIKNLIETVGTNYSKTVDSFLLSHVTELSMKQMEICASERRHIAEIDSLKNDHAKELERLRIIAETSENAKVMSGNEEVSLAETQESSKLEKLMKDIEEISVKLIKSEGIISAKEETERVLNERIKELEKIIRLKEENCQKELEDLTSKYLKEKVLSSAKDDLRKELEDDLNKSESLLVKSCEVVDRLINICSNLENNSGSPSLNKGEHNNYPEESEKRFREASSSIELLKTKFLETLEKVENLGQFKTQNEKLINLHEKLTTELRLSSEKNAALEEEMNYILEENNKMKEEISSLAGEIANKEKPLAEMVSLREELSKMSELKNKLEILEFEKEKAANEDKEKEKEILERNEFLEETVRDLMERVGDLTAELACTNVLEQQEVFSISLQQVRFLYEEEEEEEENVTPTSTIACQAELPSPDQRRAEEQLKKENERLKCQLEEEKNKAKEPFYEEAITKLKNIKKELSSTVRERNEWITAFKNLENEKDKMKEELESLQKENQAICARHEAEIKTLTNKGLWLDDSGRQEMKREIGRLNEYIKTLSKKLNVMKADNELLLSESQEHFKLNQNLVNELEEAWSQRYEIEDQLAKVRKENALLNLHRRQLEETNRKISNLLAEGRPSVVSWIKIHETVESIVDEVLALKTSFSDSGSISGTSTPKFDHPQTNSDLKTMTDTLHAQLKNKTVLCEELIFQKETLQKELRNLEYFIRANDSKPTALGQERSEQPRFSTSDELHSFDWKMRNLSVGTETEEVPSQMVFNNFKENRLALVGGQLRESWELELENFKEEIQKMQDNDSEGDENEHLKSMEIKYEEEVKELSRQFEEEVDKLKKTFGSDEGNSQESYEIPIQNLKKHFEEKWKDLKKRYAEIYSKQKQKRVISLETAEIDHFQEQLLKILQERSSEERRKIEIECLLKNIFIKRNDEINSVREKYKEALTKLEKKHASEVQKLHSVVLKLKEDINMALKEGAAETAKTKEHQDLISTMRSEFENKLEEEKKRHIKEMQDLEEFWTEKLSECETKCAILKATSESKNKSQPTSEESFLNKITEISKSESEQTNPEENQIESDKVTPNLSLDNCELEKPNAGGNFRISWLADHSFFKRMELETDDDKLDVIQQRDTLEEMILSMRNIITKLLTFIWQQKPELNNTFGDIDDTLYKSINFDLNPTVSDISLVSNSVMSTMDLSTIFQEIKENSLLNSSDHIRFEIEKCLKQLKNDAQGLLALSCAENGDQNLHDIIKRILRNKKELEEKVVKVEEMQSEIKKEIGITRERLSQWERNLEVVSEGCGEEIVRPKPLISLADAKDKFNAIFTENCGHSMPDINMFEELCKEKERLQDEWMKERCDLQQQIDVADKQLLSLKKFLEEQAVEREQEREAFDREINKLQESLKAKERDNSVQNRTNREVGRLSLPLADQSVEALTAQIKALSSQLTETEKNKELVEGEFQGAVKKIWSLRELIEDLESQLAEVSERESNLKKKVEKLELLVEEHSKANGNLRDELETCRQENELKYSEHIRALEEELTRLRRTVDQVNPDSLTQLKANLRQIEVALIRKTKDLEQLHVSSANVSCSSPSEDISIRDHMDATRCSTPDEMCTNTQPLPYFLPMEEIDRVHEKLARHSRAEEVTMKYIQDLKMQLRNHRKAIEEIQTERDVLLEKVDVYLKENSSLKVRLEEQRCNAGLVQKQLNANLESQINRLEAEVEKLNELCNDKDKQLREMKTMLDNTTKSLKIREAEASNRSKEENTLITTLKTDLANALNKNEKLEETLEKTKEKLKETLKMPALIDSMIDDKNAEIDRLEKELARVSSEKTSSRIHSSSYGSEDKHKRKIRFSEPESFSENISSISVQCLSDLRNCSDSCADLKNFSFRSRRPIGSSTKLESVSSIAPLQLSPRGSDPSINWKTSSPILPNETPKKSPLKTIPTKLDTSQMEETAKLLGEIESKQREISELHLEIDILKRQLVESNEAVATAKSDSKEIRNELGVKDDEIRKLKTSEKNLLMMIDSLKKNHAEEVDELHNQLNFEHQKVEKVYEEIKALEEKKIKIEEAFLNFKEEYNDKIQREIKATEIYLKRIGILRTLNDEWDLRLAIWEKELKKTIKESEETILMLRQEISDLKTENEKIRSASPQKDNAETQCEMETCDCLKSFTFDIPNAPEAVVPNLEQLKTEFDKMVALIEEKDFNKKEAYLYAQAIRRLMSDVLTRIHELTKKVEARTERTMEHSVDDLAVKVQKELVLSAKLDNKLLSSIEANGFTPKEVIPHRDSLDLPETLYKETSKGDKKFIVPNQLGYEAMLKVAGLYKDMVKKLAEFKKERENLMEKVSNQQKIIKHLEDSLAKEQEKIVCEIKRCSDDAKIMELLRVNLEKRLMDIKTKEKELDKEKHLRRALEKELESLKLSEKEPNEWESKKLIELNDALKSQRQKLRSVELKLEEEKKKNEELSLSLEQARIERAAERNAFRLMEADLNLLREQKNGLRKEVLKIQEILHSRNMEIGLLKRKINLQEIDLKALSLSSHPSDASSIANDVGNLVHSPFSLLVKMRKFGSSGQRHMQGLQDLTNAEETLPYFFQEAAQMKGMIGKLEEDETRLGDETIVPDVEIESKLWALEKERLIMDLETLKRENEIFKRNLVDTCKSNDALRQENTKLRKKVKSPKKQEVLNYKTEDVCLLERISQLTKKYLKAESYRKALAWQKQYLLRILQDYQRSEEEACKWIGRRKKESKRKEIKPCGRFRIVALAAVAISRMKFIVKRREKSVLKHMLSFKETKPCEDKLTSVPSNLSIHSEPLDPLSYQTRYIIRRTPGQVLRTPPSHDPGFQDIFDSNNSPE